MLLIIATGIIAFIIVLLTMPNTIKMLKEKGITGTDVHKIEKPEVAKGAGFVVLFAIVTSLLIIIGATTLGNGSVNPGLLAALVSILMAGLIGQLDDDFDFRNRTKIILPLIASIPMAAMQVGTSTMSIPFIGTINLGIIYPLVVIPLLMTFIIDSTNMYGGMNGLESGLAAINSSAIILFVLFSPFFSHESMSSTNFDAGIIAGALLGATLAFLIFNKFPARVLPGDVGRLPIGATIAAALILGNMDRMAIILYFPFGINFILFIIYKLYVKRTGIEYQKFATPREDGTLSVVGPFTMYWVLPHFMRIDEKRNVRLLWLIQAIVAYGAVAVLLIGIPLGIGWI
ncbi:MAG: hypothetical protein K9W43_00830 [Candidatus Thorarchaeota archaeon]|nr:hypothetical protein [Candidatus Thorarchaeota archaeon]